MEIQFETNDTTTKQVQATRKFCINELSETRIVMTVTTRCEGVPNATDFYVQE